MRKNRAMKKGLIFSHWTDGGTIITIFEKERLPLYLEAVIQANDPELVLSDQAMVPAPKDYGGSLHNVGAPLRDLSYFWRIFDEIKRAS